MSFVGEIGTSFAFPSNGFSVLSPTCSSEVYIQEINTLKGMTSQTMFPFITPSTLSLSLSNSVSNPKGSRRQNNLMKKELTVAYCLGYGKSLIDFCMSRNSATPIKGFQDIRTPGIGAAFRAASWAAHRTRASHIGR